MASARAHVEFNRYGWGQGIADEFYEVDDSNGNIIDQVYGEDYDLNWSLICCVELDPDMLHRKEGHWLNGDRLFCIHDFDGAVILTDHPNGGRLQIRIHYLKDRFDL